jgi:hypothetical protein
MMNYYLFYWWIRDGYRSKKQWLKNCWRFRKELSNFYDYNYDLGLLRKTLEFNYMALVKGNEVEISRFKKLDKIQRCIEILRHFEEDDFVSLAEEALGKETILHSFKFEPVADKEEFMRLVDDYTEEEREHNHEIFNKASDIQDKLWIELWKTIQGQDYEKLMKPKTVKGKLVEPEWDDLFDGSGLLGWWD